MKLEDAMALHIQLCNDLKKNLTYPKYLEIKEQIILSQNIIEFLYADYLFNLGKELIKTKNNELDELYDLLLNCYGITRENLIYARRGYQK